MAEVTDLAKQ